MSLRVAVHFACVSLGVVLAASGAAGYIHLPPMTLQEMCKGSSHIRLLKVEKLNKEKGVIVFEVAESLKDDKSRITTFSHVIRTDAEGVQPILDWAGQGKTAMMFSVESKPRGQVYGYVFIDGNCYSVDYNTVGRYWLMLRAEPGMSSCYHGSVERLREAVQDILNGKEVKVPTRQPDARVNPDKRVQEITQGQIDNRRRLEDTLPDETKPALPETNSGNSSPKAAWVVAGISAGIAIAWVGWWILRRTQRMISPTQAELASTPEREWRTTLTRSVSEGKAPLPGRLVQDRPS
jgi:hypothetical protein